jgi:Bifunctional DNA primase/polymerase, N-terminal
VTIVDETSAEALRHERRGWSTLPLRGKEPNGRLIRHTRGSGSWASFQSRRAEPDEIKRWFELDENTDVGVCTGEISGGLVVVDADDETEAPTGELPPTATVRTGNGRHYYLHADKPIRSRDFHWGELRGEGRYVVAPASRHASGRRYLWELEPEETGLAPLAETLLARTRESAGPGAPIRSTWELRSTWESAAPGPELVDRLAHALGVPEARYGRPFRCLLHDDGRPSAAFWRASEDAQILYHDFHAGRWGGPAWLPLSRVRAHVAGRRGYLGKPELAVWRLRLAAEVGQLEPVSFDAPAVPRGLEPLWAGFLYLLGIRWTVSPGEPAPFTRRFAAAWCGVSEWEARDGLAELQRRGLLSPAGRDPHGTRLWLPEGVAPID